MDSGLQINQNDSGTVQPRGRVAREIRSWVLTLGIPIIVVLLLNTFICRIAFVIGDSMYPTLHPKDVLLVRLIGYSPQNGDIVVIGTKENRNLDEDYIVKRVIALAGQTVVIDYDLNTVTVDGELLPEPYINSDEDDPLRDRRLEGRTGVTVPEGCVFVMGDNRNYSLDSRSEDIGMVPEGDIMGGVILTVPAGRLLSGG